MSRSAAAKAELKKLLAEAGHADWVTYHEGHPFDLFYTEARVAVKVFGCMSYGCPVHGKWKTESWTRVVRKNMAAYNRSAIHLQKLHWRTIYCYDCDVIDMGEKTIARIVNVLESQRSKMNAATSEYGPRSDGSLARLCALDMANRITRPAWIRFLEVTRDVMSLGPKMGTARKKDIRAALVVNEKWDTESLNVAWRGAKWHYVIRMTKGLGTVRGELWRAALEEADIPLA